MRGGHFTDELIVLAHDGGISISTDSGDTFERRYDGLNVQQNWAHSIDKDFTYLISAMQDIGFYRYSIANESWKMIGGGEGGLSIVSKLNTEFGIGNQYSGGGSNRGVIKYFDYGNKIMGLQQVNIGPFHVGMRPYSETTSGDIYMGMKELYKTSDFASTQWIKVSNIVSDSVKGDILNDFIISIENSEIDTNLIALAYSNISWNFGEYDKHCSDPDAVCPVRKVLVSHDKGQTWLDKTWGTNGVKLPIEYSNLSKMIISPQDPSKMWVIFGGYRIGEKVFYSPDTGNTWFNHSYNLPNQPVNSIVFQPNSNDRVYVATDIGIFTKDAAMNNWECYNTNLPPAIYNHLDVNNCGGALTVSAHGRGIYKSPLAANTIVGNVLWDKDGNVGSNITVVDTLTITASIEMAANTKITVEPGGKLILDGGTLTSSHCIESTWQGIVLLGDPSKNQNGNPMDTSFNQGYVLLKNNALIEDAEVAINVGNLNANDDDNGGLVHMESGSTIKNCKRGIVVKEYSKQNKSHYFNANFINDESKNDPQTGSPLQTEVFVDIIGTTVAGHEFDSCTFERTNYASASFFDTDKWVGIRIGRRLGTTSNPFIQNSTFEGLTYGLWASNLSSGIGNDILNNEFEYNQRGMYILSGYSLKIADNTFKLADPLDSTVYGIMTGGLITFDIRENTFNGADNPAQQPNGNFSNVPMGIIAENSGIAGGIIFNNAIGDANIMDISLQSQGDNQSLTIRCNDFNVQGAGFTNPHGLTVYDKGITAAQLRDQGHENCQGNNQNEPQPHKAAAGNKWQTLCPGGSLEDIDFSSGVLFKYYWHSYDENFNPTTEPSCSDPQWQAMQSHYVDCNVQMQNNSCDDLYTPPGSGGGGGPGPGLLMKSGMDSIQIGAYYSWYYKLLSQQAKLIAKSNGSLSEDSMVNVFKNANMTSAAYQHLINSSPLSDRPIAAVIEKWVNQEDSLLMTVLKKNMPLSKSHLIKLKQSAKTIKIGQLINKPTRDTLRDSLSQIADQIQFAKQECHLAEAALYRHFIASGSEKSAYKLLDTSIFSASLRLLARDYISRDRKKLATALLNRIETYAKDGHLKGNQQFVKVQRQLMKVLENEKSLSINNDYQLAALNALLDETNGKHKEDLAWTSEVEAIIQSLTQKRTHHPIVSAKSSSQAPPEEGVRKELSRFILYPNPNTGIATIAYQLEGEKPALLDVFDINGRLVFQGVLKPKSTQLQLNVSHLTNGMYHFSVSLQEERIQSGKMVISKP